METPRLLLEAIVPQHADALCQIYSSPTIHEYVSFEPPTRQEQERRYRVWCDRFSADQTRMQLNWLVRLKEDGETAAHMQVGITSGIATLGYAVDPTFQNKGYATEAMKVVIDYLITKLKVTQIDAYTDARNTASISLLKRIGMRERERVKDANPIKDGGFSDELIFELKN